eukprot:gene7846-8695_t
MTKRLLPVYLLVIWLASTAVASPMIYAQKLSKIDGKMYCAESWGRPFDAVESPKHYTIILFVTLYAIPLFIMALLYTAIGRKLWKRHIPGHRSFESENIALKQKRKVIKMLVSVVLAFAICWFPIFLAQFLFFFNPHFMKCPKSFPEWFAFTAYFLQYTSSGVSPCLYFLFSGSYRKGWKVAFGSVIQSTQLSPIGISGAFTSLRLKMKVPHQVVPAPLEAHGAWSPPDHALEGIKEETSGDFDQGREEPPLVAKNELIASIRLQKFIRGCLCRKHEAKKFRNLFDQDIVQLKQVDLTAVLGSLPSFIRLIAFFFNPLKDHDRLIVLCQIVIKLSSSKDSTTFWGVENCLHHIRSLLFLCIRTLGESKDQSTSLAVPLRMLEIFTDAKKFEFIYEDEGKTFSKLIMLPLIQKGYFKCLHNLINTKVPSSLEMSARPPTPFAATVKEITLRPIHNVCSVNQTTHVDSSTRHSVLCSFAAEFLCQEMTDQVFLFFVPSIASEISLHSLLDALLAPPGHADGESQPQSSQSDKQYQRTQQQQQQQQQQLRLAPSPWLLYSLLTFGKEQLANISGSDVAKYLLLLKLLMPHLPPPKASTGNSSIGHISDSDSDDDMEVELSEDDAQLWSKNLALRDKCLQLLDSNSHVQKLVSSVEHPLSQRLQTEDELKDETMQNCCIEALCHVAYSMFTKQRLLLHETNLLRCLAFNHNFIRSCWMIICNMKTKTALGGSAMKEDEKDRIIAMLSVFCSLFRHALFCIYDTDFYSADAGTTTSMMPFALKELVGMSTSLLDVLIGLVQMMFSDTRANVVAAYGKAMLSVGAGPLGHSDFDAWSSLFQGITQLVKQLHSRDNRHQFCPEGHWLSPRIAINADQVTLEGYLENPESEEGPAKPGMSALTARSLAILRNIPFSVPFVQRVKSFAHQFAFY